MSHENNAEADGNQIGDNKVAVTLPPPKPFQVCNTSSLAQKWEKWKCSFNYFIEATGMTNDSQKRATLLHLLGEETQDIFHTFLDTGNTYAEAITELDAHFIPKKNTPYERSIFRQAKQGSDENIDNFCTRLRKLALYCEYVNLDDELRDQIISSCSSSKLRKRLLVEETLTLTKTLSVARAMEISTSYVQWKNLVTAKKCFLRF